MNKNRILAIEINNIRRYKKMTAPYYRIRYTVFGIDYYLQNTSKLLDQQFTNCCVTAKKFKNRKKAQKWIDANIYGDYMKIDKIIYDLEYTND